MKIRRLLLLLLIPLLLISCASERTFIRESGESRYVDRKSGIAYVALDITFEAAKTGETFGSYGDESDPLALTFSKIPDLDPDLFLTDQYSGVYYAGSQSIDPATLTVTEVLLCVEGTISVALQSLKADQHADTIAEMRALWFEGEGDAELPPVIGDYYFRRVKLAFAEYPSLLYCFSFYIFEGEGAYFYDINSGRTVSVPSALAETLRTGGTV